MLNTKKVERSNDNLILVTDYDYVSKVKNNKVSSKRKEFVEVMNAIFARTDVW